jgi:hypothetical protein
MTYDNTNQPLGLSDDDLSTLDALDKLSLIKAAVTEAVSRMMPDGPDLTTEERVLIRDYRAWKQSVKSVSGVFHWRRP